MDIALGMHVFTRDDQDIGTVDRLVLDPDSGTVKAAVVRKGTFLHQDVEVPVDMLSPGGDGNARIAYSSNQVDRLPRFEESSYATPPVGYIPPMGYPPTAIYWPVGYGMGVPSFGAPAATAPVAPAWTGDTDVDREVEAAVRREDLENAVIGEGSDVLGRDGEKVGTVRELTFDPTSSELTGLVVHKGLIMGKDMKLPASMIDSVDDGVVYLKVDAKQAVK